MKGTPILDSTGKRERRGYLTTTPYAYKRYRRLWMRRWRAKPENRIHEKLMKELRMGVREKTVSEGSYWQEVWQPWKVKCVERRGQP